MVPGVVRAENEIGGWKIRKIDDNLCKITFCACPDFKIPLYLAKQVAPKSTNLPLGLKNYISR